MNLSQIATQVGRGFKASPGLRCSAQGVTFGLMLACASLAQAAVTQSPATNIAVPVTTAGIYINVVTGAAGTAAATPGWDINPWSSTGLSFFNPAQPTGGVYVIQSAGQVSSLLDGTTIGPASTFGSGAATVGAGAGQWSLNATNYFGFRFIGEDAELHYGWGTMVIGATLAARSVGELWYESAPNAAITITAIPEPTSLAMMLAGGLAIAGVVARRRRQTQT